MIEIVVNELALDGMRRVRVMSDKPVSEAWMCGYVPGIAREFAQVKCEATAALSLFYGEVTFPVRGVVEVRLEGMPRPRRLAAWKMMPGERMSLVIRQLADWYFAQTHQRAGFAFVRKLPRSAIPQGDDISAQLLALEESCDIYVLEAEWCLDGCVMVGG